MIVNIGPENRPACCPAKPQTDRGFTQALNLPQGVARSPKRLILAG